MRRLHSTLLLIVFLACIAAPAPVGAGCKRCAFGGLCRVDGESTPCGLSQFGCIPRRGILTVGAGNAYWVLYARKRPGPRGHLHGKLSVYAIGGPLRTVPGFFFGECAHRLDLRDARFPDICIGERAPFAGVVVGERLIATALYADGGSCEFDLTVAFGLGDPATPNRFVCRDAAGTVMSEGQPGVGAIRLFGCRP
jgi:hypothetical protein